MENQVQNWNIIKYGIHTHSFRKVSNESNKDKLANECVGVRQAHDTSARSHRSD